MTRKQALYWFNCRYSLGIHDYDKNDAYKCAIEALEEQRPKGHWIKQLNNKDGDYWQCSNCQEYMCSMDCHKRYVYISYCPNCGAKMVESQAESEK